MAEEDKHIKPFGLYLKTTNRGRTEADLSAKMHELIEQVLETGKKGTLTLTITVDADDADARRLVLTEKVVSKLPQPDPRKSIFFADDTGNLTRNDPSQLAFDGIQAVKDVTKEESA